MPDREDMEREALSDWLNARPPREKPDPEETAGLAGTRRCIIGEVAGQRYPSALIRLEFFDPEGILPIGDRDELDDDVAHMVAGDAAELIENHWRVKATVVRGFDRLEALARQILDEVYPASVFGDASSPDSDASDPGVRLVRALRACEAARNG